MTGIDTRQSIRQRHKTEHKTGTQDRDMWPRGTPMLGGSLWCKLEEWNGMGNEVVQTDLASRKLQITLISKYKKRIENSLFFRIG